MTDKKQPTKTKQAKRSKQAPVIDGELVETEPTYVPMDQADTAADDAAPDASPENQAALIKQDTGVVGPMIGGISTDELRQSLAVQTEQRELVKEFVQHHLVDGTDYGRIHVVSRDRCPDQERCKKDYHYSKAVLFKPGQEKLFSLFRITDKLERDEETYAMLPNIGNLVAYKCTLYRSGQVIGHGRGSAVVGDNRRDANATIKIAEKRARMDACLSLGFSEYFAQDLDDPDYKSQAEMANQRVAAQAEARDFDKFGLLIRDAKLSISNPERETLTRMFHLRGYKEWDDILAVLKLNGIDNPQSMTSGQAKGMIEKLHNRTFAAPVVEQPSEPVAPVDDQIDVDAALDTALSGVQAPTTAAPSPAAEESELVVDDDLKANVTELYKSIGLNNRGDMWFMKYVSGRPFGGFEKFSDEHWRKAFDLIQDILDQRLEVDDHYLAGVITDDEPPAPVDPSEPKSRQLGNVQQAIPGATDITPGEEAA